MSAPRQYIWHNMGLGSGISLGPKVKNDKYSRDTENAYNSIRENEARASGYGTVAGFWGGDWWVS